MTPADAVLEDALREAGFGRVTPWHVRCVEAWAAAQNQSCLTVRQVEELERRFKSDLYADGLAELHVAAQRFDARWTAKDGPGRESLRRQFGITPRVDARATSPKRFQNLWEAINGTE